MLPENWELEGEKRWRRGFKSPWNHSRVWMWALCDSLYFDLLCEEDSTELPAESQAVKPGKYHSFKLSCEGGRTLRTDLEHTHIDVLCTMCMYILELIYACYICVCMFSVLFTCFFQTFSCSYFHGMRHLPFAFILMVVCIMWHFRDLANRKPHPMSLGMETAKTRTGNCR